MTILQSLLLRAFRSLSDGSGSFVARTRFEETREAHRVLEVDVRALFDRFVRLTTTFSGTMATAWGYGLAKDCSGL